MTLPLLEENTEVQHHFIKGLPMIDYYGLNPQSKASAAAFIPDFLYIVLLI